MILEPITQNHQVIAVLCNQFGDTGKGKVVDLLAKNWADVVARGTGGANAGHTVWIGNDMYIFHVVPSGILNDADGKYNVIGNGVVVSLEGLCEELDALDAVGLPYDNLLLSKDAHAILPNQIARDQQRNSLKSKGGVGSTGRGIGPVYGDKVLRRGIRFSDFFEKDVLVREVRRQLEHYPEFDGDIDEIVETQSELFKRVKPHVADTVKFMHDQLAEGKKVVLEGAQGLLLSHEFGTYRFVTSSDCSAAGTAQGVGIPGNAVDLVLGIVKFPYMTRVGAGPFVTEYGGSDSEQHCAEGLEHDIFYEVNEYLGAGLSLEAIRGLQRVGDSTALAGVERTVMNYIKDNQDKVVELINSGDPFKRGVGIRMAGFEYGATTKRPRRTGATDLVALRHAMMVNGPNVVLTKVDVPAGAHQVELCNGYNYRGAPTDSPYGQLNSHRTILDDFPRETHILEKCKPVNTLFGGWGDVSGVQNYEDFPDSFKMPVAYLEDTTGMTVLGISNGPDQEQFVVR